VFEAECRVSRGFLEGEEGGGVGLKEMERSEGTDVECLLYIYICCSCTDGLTSSRVAGRGIERFEQEAESKLQIKEDANSSFPLNHNDRLVQQYQLVNGVK